MKLLTNGEITNSILNRLGDESGRNRTRILRMVAEAMSDANERYIPQIRTEEYEVNESFQIVLPEYAIRPLKVGRLLSDRRTIHRWELVSDMHSDIVLSGCLCNADTADSGQSYCPIHTWTNCCYGGSSYGEKYYQTPQLYAGTAKWYPHSHRIGLDRGISVGDSMIVEYELTTDDQAVVIPSSWREVIVQRVLEWHQQGRGNIGESRHAGRKFVIETNEVMKKLGEVGSYQDMVDAIRGTYTGAVKW